MLILKKLKASSPKYKTIKEVIDVLQNHGFSLQVIRPQSQKESYTEDINFVFYSLDAFFKNMYSMFREYAEKVSAYANADWSRTSFILYNEEIDMKIDLFIDEYNGNTDPCDGFLLITDYEEKRDKSLVETLFHVLDPYLIED